jgi:UDP-glucuronate 4-epimerase
LYVRRNVLATQRLFEAAAEAGLRVVWASSSSVYGEAETYPTSEDVIPRPLSPYGITKLACENLAHVYKRAFGLDVVTLRYFTIYGPRQRPDMAFSRLISALLEGSVFELYGDGSASRSFTYVSDAVVATAASMQRADSGAVYNVGGGSEATIRDVIRLLEEASDRHLRVTRGPRQAGDVARTNADIGRIKSDLGWRPRVSLREGLIAQLEWARSTRTSAPGSGRAPALAKDTRTLRDRAC